MITKQRISLAILTLICTAVAYAIVTALGALLGLVVAHADSGAPGQSGDVSVLIQKYGWWTGALVAYVAARWFIKRNAEEHWIAGGRWLSIGTAVLSVLGSVVGWRFGMDPEVITFAVLGAVPLAIPSTVNASARPEGTR